MPKYGASASVDLAKAYKENMRILPDGRAVLSSKNLMPNPRLDQFLPGGSLRFWPRLAAPPTPIARNVYVGASGERQTKQNDSPLPRHRASYTQVLAPYVGEPLTDVKAAHLDGLALARARMPFLEAVLMSDLNAMIVGETGYPAGDYFNSYAWIIGDPHSLKRRLLTDPAPGTPYTLAEGQSYEQPLPQEVPEGIPGIALLSTLPGGSPPEYFIQRVIDVADYVPASYVMDGPLRTSRRAPTENETYVGAFGRYPAPGYRFGGGWSTLLPMNTDIAFRFRTQFGMSASQGQTRVAVSGAYPGWFAYYVFPRIHWSALGIVPQIQAPDGQWYDIDYGLVGGEIPVSGFDAYFTTDDSQKINTGVTYESSELTRVDETGVPGPDQALEAPRPFGEARITAGDYTVRLTDVYRSEKGELFEGPPSRPNKITVAAGRALRVDFREEAEEGNVIPNGDYEELKPNGVPRRFTMEAAPSAFLAHSARESVISFDDSTGRTTDENLYVTSAFKIVRGVVYAVRGGIELDRGAGGAARLQVRFYTESDTQNPILTHNLVSRTVAASPQPNVVTVGPVGSGATVEWPENTSRCRIFYQLLGSGTGARNLAGRFVHVGMFRGFAAPRKRSSADAPVPALEPITDPYPDGSYMVVVEDPAWTNGKGNGFEYYGTALAIPRRRYFASGLRIPVEPNRVYCLQAEYFFEGTRGLGVMGENADLEVMPLSVINEDGQIVGRSDPTALLTPATLDAGSGSGSTYVLIEVPADGAYIEVGDSALGAGLVRVWGLQLEYGAIPTAWTDDVASSGRLIARFDTRTPGFGSASALAKRLYAPRSFLDAGAIADVPPGTDVTWAARSRERESDPWSADVTDPALLPLGRFVEIEVLASTTDLDVSPEIAEVYVTAKPPRPVLLRADGSEYPGGVLVDGLPALGYDDNTELQARQDGKPRVLETGPAGEILEGVSLRTFLDKTATMVSRDSTRGKRIFVIEGYGFRYVVHLINVRFKPNRYARVPTADHVHVATDLTGYVLEVTPL